ncbi:MAG: hypothetical protein R3Y45_05410 [Bacillota bacterium]
MKNYIGTSIKANLFRGIEAVGGKITFDDMGLTFKSHSCNVQTGETRIEYSQISTINKRNTLGVVPNGISIITKDNLEYNFVINSRKKVIEFLMSRL